jgi:DNA-binding MarR family transcriptional regulator
MGTVIVLPPRAAPDIILACHERGGASGANPKGTVSHFHACGPQLITELAKYVNMADLNLPVANRPSGTDRMTRSEPIWNIIELLFFAYRDFIGDPDDVLAKLGFGRAHHRVLHFVNRNPGMKVAELLDVLKITKQSLARVLKQLIQQGYVVQKEGANDRRQRLLSVTPKGEALAMKLAGLQTARITRALSGLGPNGHEIACRFLTAMINSEHRDAVLRLIARADRGRRSRG